MELQHNRIRTLSLDVFVNCTRQPAFPLILNVSHNNIRRLTPPSNFANRPPFVQTLDVSHNSLTSVPSKFLDFLAPALRTLNLASNRITEIEAQSFSLLGVLQSLNLANNNIMDMEKTSLKHMTRDENFTLNILARMLLLFSLKESNIYQLPVDPIFEALFT